MELFSGLRRWRRNRRERTAARGGSLDALPRELEAGTASALVELSRTIATEDWDSSIRLIVKLDAELLEVDRVNFWSFHEQTASIYCDAGYVASLRTFEHGATLCERHLPEYFAAMRDERVINMPDVKTDRRCRGLREYCAARGVSSMLDAPVWAGGRLVGVLCHEQVGPIRRWGVREEDFVTSVGQIISSAIVGRAHAMADSAARRAAFLDAVSSCVLVSLSSREIADCAASLCVPRLANLAAIWVESGEGGIECIAMQHADPIKNDLFLRHARLREPNWRREGPGMVARAVLQGQSLLIPELSPPVLERYGLDPGDAATLLGMGLRSALCIPLTAGDRTFGALTLWTCDHRYRSDELELSEDIGSRVAAALSNARLYEVARNAIRARDDFLALAAHELRTPLTALQLATDQLLQQSRRAKDAAEAARSEKVATQVRRFSALVEHILEAMRVRVEGVTLDRGPCDLADVVRKRVARVTRRAQAAGSVITVSCPASVAGPYDRPRIASVIDALLDNAVKFGHGQPIAVTLAIEGHEAVLSVRDHGIGFSPDQLSRFFDPFERGVATEQLGGLGLGLYVAKAIVDAHGGSITATSNPGDGATFVVRLPNQ